MKKILILGKKMEMGGTEIAMLALIHELLKREYDVTLMLIERTGILLERVPKEVEIKAVSFGNNKIYERLINSDSIQTKYNVVERGIAKILSIVLGSKNNYHILYDYLLKRVKVDYEEYDAVFDFHGYGYFLTALGAEKIVAKKRAVWFHDENLWWLYKTKSYFSKYDKLFCVSEAVKKQLVDYMPEIEDKTEVLLNFIDTDLIKERSKEQLTDQRYIGETKFLTIGRLEEQKGIDYLIQIARELKTRGLQFRWYVIGDGTLHSELQGMIDQYELENDVILLGMVKNPYPYLRECDLYVQPSRHEGYPITIIEARTLKKVIIASDIPSMHEQITDGINGFLVELNVKKFSDKIATVMQDEGIRQQILSNMQNDEIDFSEGFAKIQNLMCDEYY